MTNSPGVAAWHGLGRLNYLASCLSSPTTDLEFPVAEVEQRSATAV